MNASGEFRIGLGSDLHRLGEGGPLRLGGVEIDHDRHLIGHSDADVLLHAITDALLGAIAHGDIGRMFPDNEPANRGRDSADMLALACAMVRSQDFEIGNLDCTVEAQRPKLAPYDIDIRSRIAGILAIDIEQVSFKAKTGESVGPIGREEAIAAQCIVLLRRIAST